MLDRQKVEKFLTKAVDDVATAMFGALAFVGDRLALFKAMGALGPVTVEELAEKTGLQPRYLREWLNAMTAAEYVEYDASTGRYLLPPEHAAVLSDESFPLFLGGFIEMIVPAVSQSPKLVKAFKNGKGIPQSAYSAELFEAIERSTLPWYRNKLTQKWIPLMPDVDRKLREGGAAADVGCGSGRAAIAIAKGFPEAEVFGYDNHEGSIRRARANAKAEGVGKRIRFETKDAKRMPRGRFDFVSTFDVVHDSADPVGLLKAVHRSLKPDGTYLVLEMRCSDRVEDNVNSVGKFLYSVSTLYCMTQSLARNGAGLGAAMGETKAREHARDAGFREFQKLPVDDPFSVLYALHP